MKNEVQKSYYLQEVKSIKAMKTSYKIKIQILQGLIQKLRLIENNPELLLMGIEAKKCMNKSRSNQKSMFLRKNPQSEYQSTSPSFISDQESFAQYQVPSIQEYEQKIMQKRVIKFEINEEIEALEDDLFQIEKITDTKRALNDDLAKTIQKKMKQVGQKANDKKPKEQGFSFTSFSGFKSKKKEQGLSFDMISSISGVAGFGFPSYKSKEISQNFSQKNDSSSKKMNESPLESPQKKKTKSNYLGKGITGIFKNILK